MEVDLQSLFGLHVTWCAQLYSVAETQQPPPPSPRIWTRIRWALLVSKDRRHLFVTPCTVVILLFIMTTTFIKPLLSDLVWEVLNGGGGPNGDPHSGGRGELLLGLRAQRVAWKLKRWSIENRGRSNVSTDRAVAAYIYYCILRYSIMARV